MTTAVTGWRRPGRAWRIASIAVVFAIATVFSVSNLNNLLIQPVIGSQLTRIPAPFPDEATRPPAATGPAATAQNILFLGADSWNSVNGSLTDIRGQRSDTIMVIHIPADRKRVYVMSIMRDSLVTLPGRGPDKINAALSYGGVPLAVQTVEELIGTRIDHVALVDYAGFSGLTDALGGVDIVNPTGFASSSSDHVFPAGPQHLDGTEVLAFAREWRAFPDGDFQRVRNQQLVIRAVLASAMKRDTLANPDRISALLGAVKPFVAVDDGFNLGYLTGLGGQLASIRAPDFTFFTAPTTGVGTSADGQSVVNLNWSKIALVKQAFQSDALTGYQPEYQTMQ